MVRAGMVPHPAHWQAGGYHKIQAAPQRYRIVNRAALAELLGVERLSRLAVVHAQWIEAAVRAGGQRRVPVWSESLAVGGREFVARVGTELGVRARHRHIVTYGDLSVLRDPSAPYGSHSGPEIALLSGE
jgi:hypothetical protein